MQARPGDEVVIEGHRVGTAPRHGEVLDVEGAMLRVAWDDGHESALIPGSDCRVVRDTADEARTSPEEAHVERFGTTIDLRLLEDPGTATRWSR